MKEGGLDGLRSVGMRLAWGEEGREFEGNGADEEETKEGVVDGMMGESVQTR